MKRRVSTEERKLWRTAMRNAVPLREDETFAELMDDGTPPPIPVKARQAHKPLFREPVPAPKPTGLSQDVDARTLTRFKRGQMPIDGTIDLHGHRLHEARDALLGFVRQQHGRGSRCLLVIHGKGMLTGAARIKKALPDWLSEIPDMVLTHALAQPQHGGGGASYVLLRRKRVT